jgi:hypothetical protein
MGKGREGGGTHEEGERERELQLPSFARKGEEHKTMSYRAIDFK